MTNFMADEKEEKGIPSPFMPTPDSQPTMAKAITLPKSSLDLDRLEACRQFLGVDCVMFIIQRKKPEKIEPKTMQKVEIMSLGFDDEFARNIIKVMTVVPAPNPDNNDSSKRT